MRNAQGLTAGYSGTGAIAIYPLLLRHLRPDAEIWATEIDAASLLHAQDTLRANDIPASSIKVLRADPGGRVLSPLFDRYSNNERNDGRPFDLVICNPPFFSSAEEIRNGTELKAEEAHAAPTAADNELITPGGEVAFVRRMIEESLEANADERSHGPQLTCFTSLIGKYSSLPPLIDGLKRNRVSLQ